MSLINPAILYGLGLAAIPVILHLLMRSRPKKLLFPALRLIQARRKTNTRRMRLRHIWLLLLRIAVIALIVAAVARPSLPAANYAPNLYESLMTAAVAAAAVGVYWFVIRHWRRRQLPQHTLAYRRTLLRGGTGVAVLILLLLLVVWPYQRRIAAEISRPLRNVAEDLPVAALFLFDTSLSMQYRYESNTRLQRAQEIAGKHRSNFPSGSRLAVADTAETSPILFQADLLGAQDRIDSLQISPAHVPIDDRLKDALDTQEDDRRRTLDLQQATPQQLRRDRFLREIYVFTDMARSSWRRAASPFLRDRLASMAWLNVYLIDVGVLEPTNQAVSQLRLSKQTVPRGGDLIVQATLQAAGTTPASGRHIAELYAENDSGKLVKQGQQPVDFRSNSAVDVSFTIHGLNRPITHGEVRLITDDPVPGDDVRYFTVAVRSPPEILVVSESPNHAVYWRTALAPPQLESQGRARYRVVARSASQLLEIDLPQYDAICLINVRRPSEAAWRNIVEYVRAGGGLAVLLGMPNGSVSPAAVAYNRPTAQVVLPAELLADLEFLPPATLDVEQPSHPIFRRFEDLGTGELASVEVRHYWRVDPRDDASVIATYTDPRRSPALLERMYGNGRTVMLTTAVDLENEWNDLPRVWSFLAFADQMMQHLSRRAESVYNHIAGEDVVVQLEGETLPRRLLLRKPRFQQLPVSVPSRAEFVTIDNADQMGHYDLIADEGSTDFSTGFSVNASGDESDFTRITAADLDELLGEGRYRIAENTETLERFISEGRFGREVFSLLLIIVIIAFCAEQIVANRFYEAEQSLTHQ